MLSNKAKKLKVKSGAGDGDRKPRGRLLSLDGGGIKGLVITR
jgi:hypothetical protein